MKKISLKWLDQVFDERNFKNLQIASAKVFWSNQLLLDNLHQPSFYHAKQGGKQPSSAHTDAPMKKNFC